MVSEKRPTILFFVLILFVLIALAFLIYFFMMREPEPKINERETVQLDIMISETKGITDCEALNFTNQSVNFTDELSPEECKSLLYLREIVKRGDCSLSPAGYFDEEIILEGEVTKYCEAIISGDASKCSDINVDTMKISCRYFAARLVQAYREKNAALCELNKDESYTVPIESEDYFFPLDVCKALSAMP
ncbi:hypothetical protein JW707_05115 [Candidatus Woesearchaeota archaeon]|nr:hypothetical protein [Candidatus Woesearchaeota archaeon]